MDREKRLMYQLQQGLGSISEIVKSVKDQHQTALKEISDATFESIQTAIDRVQTIQHQVETRHTAMDKAVDSI